jgi:putative phosphoesterase
VRIAVISDTHLPRGTRRLPKRCLNELARAELILHAGDFVTAAVLDELRALAPVEAVHGNMDEQALRSLLPLEHVVEAGAARIGMVHDPGPRPGRAERLAKRFPGCDAVVYGHTHEPEATRSAATWILNPGSPTERRRAPSRAMLVLDATDRALEPRLLELI